MYKTFKRFATFGAVGALAGALGVAGLTMASGHTNSQGTRMVRLASDDITASPTPQPTISATAAPAPAAIPVPVATASPDSDDAAETPAEEQAEGPEQANELSDDSSSAASLPTGVSPVVDDSGHHSSSHDGPGHDGPGHD